MTSPLSSRRRSKTPPPGETGQEALYLRSLSDRQVPVAIKLRDGETVRGWIEYFDDAMLRLTREGQPNLFIYKHQIRTITEAGEARCAARRVSARDRSRTVSTSSGGLPVSGRAGSNGFRLGSQGLGHCRGGRRAAARVFCRRAWKPSTRATWTW